MASTHRFQNQVFRPVMFLRCLLCEGGLNLIMTWLSEKLFFFIFEVEGVGVGTVALSLSISLHIYELACSRRTWLTAPQ